MTGLRETMVDRDRFERWQFETAAIATKATMKPSVPPGTRRGTQIYVRVAEPPPERASARAAVVRGC